MTSKRMITGGILTCAALLLALPVLADVVTVFTFDNVPPNVVCNEIWQENGVDIRFTTTTSEDCDGGGNCFFGVDVGFVWLYPSRLVIDLGDTYAVSLVEVVWIDFCGIGCSRAFVYDGAATVGSTQNTVVGVLETVSMMPVGGQADRIAVSSCEGQLLEVRITTDVVANDSETWGSIKSLYR